MTGSAQPLPASPAGPTRRWLGGVVVWLFAAYAIALFVPATDAGYYYDVREPWRLVVNPVVWHLLLAGAVLASLFTVLDRRIEAPELVLLLTGALFIGVNLSLAVNSSASAFNYMGLILLTTPALRRLPRAARDKVVVAAVLAVAAGSVLILAELLYWDGLAPVMPRSLVQLAEDGGEVRLVNPSLYGQGNAAGGAIAFALLYLLLRIRDGQRGLPALAFVAGLGVLATTQAFGPFAIVLSLLVIGFWALSGLVRVVATLVLVGVLVVALLHGAELLEFISYKLASGSVKLERAHAFFDMVAGRPDVLLLGENPSRAPGTGTFYTESSLLDLWLAFGVLGVLGLVSILLVAVAGFLRARDGFGVMTVGALAVLLVSQNSTLMPACLAMLVLLVAEANDARPARR